MAGRLNVVLETIFIEDNLKLLRNRVARCSPGYARANPRYLNLEVASYIMTVDLTSFAQEVAYQTDDVEPLVTFLPVNLF